MKEQWGKTVAFAGVIALVTGLAACSSNDENGNDSASGKTELVYWQHSFEARDNQVEVFVKDFEATNPDVTVTTQFIPYDQYFSKLTTGLQSGTGPDIFQVPEEMSEQLTSAGTIAPVPDSVISGDQISSNYISSTIDRWKVDEEYYGLPTDVQTALLFFNNDLLEECGGDPTDPPPYLGCPE